jgi:hypothetical protein
MNDAETIEVTLVGGPTDREVVRVPKSTYGEPILRSRKVWECDPETGVRSRYLITDEYAEFVWRAYDDGMPPNIVSAQYRLKGGWVEALYTGSTKVDITTHADRLGDG